MFPYKSVVLIYVILVLMLVLMSCNEIKIKVSIDSASSNNSPESSEPVSQASEAEIDSYNTGGFQRFNVFPMTNFNRGNMNNLLRNLLARISNNFQPQGQQAQGQGGQGYGQGQQEQEQDDQDEQDDNQNNGNNNSNINRNMNNSPRSQGSPNNGGKSEIFSGLNSLRNSVGSPNIAYSNCLDAIAQAHANDMVARNFFDHTNPSGESVPERINKGLRSYPACSGQNYMTYGENIAMGGSPKQALQMWRNSQVHYQNEVNRDFTLVGVGIARNKYVQVFGG